MSLKAKEAFEKKDFPTAIKYYAEAISSDPNNHILFFNRSACYANIGKYEKALEDAKRCVELKPDFVHGYSRKGLAEFYLKKYEDAKKSYEEGLKLNPNDEHLKEGLEIVNSKQGPFEAKEEVKTSLSQEEVAKEKADKAKAKGNSEYKQRHFEEALKYYDEAISLNPKEPVYYLNKSAVYFEMQEFNQSITACNKAIEVGEGLLPKPFDKIAKAYTRKANCYCHMNEWDKALEMYDRSLLEVNDHNVKEAKRECEKQKKAYEEAQYLDPTKGEKAKERGNQLYKNGNYAEAIKEYTESIKRNPKVAAVYLDRGMSYMKILTYDKALEDLNKAIELNPQYVKAYAKKANAHYFLKEYHKAMEAYNKGLELDPNNNECLEGRQKTQTAVYQAAPDPERARKALDDPEIRALIQDPRIVQALNDAKENPENINHAMQDPFIAQGIEKLIEAGVLGVK